MCRLLAYAAPSPTSALNAVGADALETFTAMARLHNQGWGVARITAEHRVAVAKSPESGAHDPGFSTALRTPLSSAGIVHLRLATTGMALEPANTHPFLAPDSSMAFAHNGGATPASLMEPLIAPSLRAQVQGTTDSERYAAVVRTVMARGLPPAQAAAEAVSLLRPLYPIASLNALLLTPRELIVIHASSTSRIPHHDFDASGLSDAEMPADHRSGYFQLWMRRSPDGTVVFSSSGLPTSGWEPLAPDTVTRVDLATMGLSVVPVGSSDEVSLESVA